MQLTTLHRSVGQRVRFCHRPQIQRHVSLRIRRIRCSEGDREKTDAAKEKTTEAVFTEILRKQGMEPERAQRILQAWKESGSENPEQLRRLFLRGSLRPLSVILVQLFLDAGATYGSFVFAATITAAPGLPAPYLISALGTFAGFYFLSSTAFDIVTLAAVLWSIYRFGTNTDAFLKALQTVAGGSDLNVIDKAKKIVDVFKIIQALNEIADILRVGHCIQCMSSCPYAFRWHRRRVQKRFRLWKISLLS